MASEIFRSYVTSDPLWSPVISSITQEADYSSIEVIGMNAIRCLTIIYCIYQFKRLLKSKYIFAVATVFTIFSSIVFTSTVLNIFAIRTSDLRDALFFFLLLIDLSRAAVLAMFAFDSKGPNEVKSNIANGLSLLGPGITLDTIVEILLISVGTLSGIPRLEILSWLACLSVLVNYIIFMTFYPACLSLVLELSFLTNFYKTKVSLLSMAFKEEDQKPNPVIQRVKLIMAAGLVLVHAKSRWMFNGNEEQDISLSRFNRTDDSVPSEFVTRWLNNGGDILLISIIAIVIKFMFVEDHEINSSEKQNIEKMPESNFTIDGPVYEDKEVQTSPSIKYEDVEGADDDIPRLCRTLEECLKIYRNVDLGATALSDDELMMLIRNRHIAPHQIEKAVDDPERGVGIRRKMVEKEFLVHPGILADLPYKNYDYSKVMGACCENVIGYMPVPVGYAGPLFLDGKELYIPMATTEGCLVASTNRGCRALRLNGVTSSVVGDGMTRGPVVRFPSITRASDAMGWVQDKDNYQKIKEQFDSSSRFARLQRISVKIAGRYLFMRFVATTGDAMGMNMLSKGTEYSLKYVQQVFKDMEILSLSGNFCTDKKPAAVNWIEGRGKSVVCEAIVPAKIIGEVLKTNVNALIDVNNSKNLIGSAVAGSIGGFNAHAANIVTAIFIATGQDPAQNVGSSNCMTLMEPWGLNGEDLYMSCTMPCIELGTVGGGTILPAQGACLDILGVKGANLQQPGANSAQLAKIVCGTVLAGELSLLSALTAGDLVKSHLRHNRSTTVLSQALDPSKNRYLLPCKDMV
ncbi:3-hydroxy-3-methylglutaryl-coenzyme A reductase-like isoform X2 [Rhynchophorus ferrugineus]|uniref:3-hydroxy-3-methylglutaryl-coenzyme A reductase-like isoform X2 n=1 Tax=Rhynchophorus ferrugineus TaxID=354439 RepID=UPI003FCCD2DF